MNIFFSPRFCSLEEQVFLHRKKRRENNFSFCKHTATYKNFTVKYLFFMIERESEFLAVAHRKMDRVIVFHRLVTKTTSRRHKNWFSSRITSGEIPWRRGGILTEIYGLWQRRRKLPSPFTPSLFFHKLKLHINKTFILLRFLVNKTGDGRKMVKSREKEKFANTFLM